MEQLDLEAATDRLCQDFDDRYNAILNSTLEEVRNKESDRLARQKLLGETSLREC